MSAFSISDWYVEFLDWMSDARRLQETIEILSDCSNELYLNAITALHLRQFGREKGLETFWARSEWNKTDISLGEAKLRFTYTPTAWEEQWRQRNTGDVGQIEAKLLYWHYGESQCCASIATLGKQLDSRRRYDLSHKREGQRYWGIVWLLGYSLPEALDSSTTAMTSPHDHNGVPGWKSLFSEARLDQRVAPTSGTRSVGSFELVGHLHDMSTLWPTTDRSTASLFVTVREQT